MTSNIYNTYGFADRIAYLSSLADEYNIDLDTIQYAADTLGVSEDFDGLISLLDDIE